MKDGVWPRFVVDHMLIKLGTYLRVLGCDAVWDRSVRTHELIGLANAEERIFLTRNTHLSDQYPAVRRKIMIQATEPVGQLHEVIVQTGIDPQERLFSACIRCNVPLEGIADREAVRDRVHPNVYARYSAFYRCPVCDTVFWKGSHVRNTCRKLGLTLESEFEKASTG